MLFALRDSVVKRLRFTLKLMIADELKLFGNHKKLPVAFYYFFKHEQLLLFYSMYAYFILARFAIMEFYSAFNC